MKLPPQRSAGDLQVQMTPMIDVVFLLLVFFLWTSSFETPEFDLPGALAETPAGGRDDSRENEVTIEAFDEIIVRLVIRDGLRSIQLGDEQIASIDSLHSRIEEIIELGVQPPVIVDPEPEITMEFAIAVYDAIRRAGADRILYATDS